MGTDSGGFPWANVVHFKYSGSLPTVATLTAMATNMAANWSTLMAPHQATNLTLTRIKLTDLSGPTSAVFELGESIAGTLAGDFLPASAAFLISYPGIAFRYRGGHPRQYLNVGVQASLVDEAHWQSAFVTAVTSGWSNFINADIGATFVATTITDQVAVSYYTTDYGPPKTRVVRPVPLVYVLPSIVGNAQLASQRSRIGRKRR